MLAANSSQREKCFRGDGLKVGMINVCDICGMLERINQDGMGKRCVNSGGVCVGPARRKARLSLGGPGHLRTSWLRLLPARMRRVRGTYARAEAPLGEGAWRCAAGSSPGASRDGHERLNYLPGKGPGGVLEPLPETQG